MNLNTKKFFLSLIPILLFSPLCIVSAPSYCQKISGFAVYSNEVDWNLCRFSLIEASNKTGIQVYRVTDPLELNNYQHVIILGGHLAYLDEFMPENLANVYLPSNIKAQLETNPAAKIIYNLTLGGTTFYILAGHTRKETANILYSDFDGDTFNNIREILSGTNPYIKETVVTNLIEKGVSEGELAFIFLGKSGLIIKTKEHLIAIDVANYLKPEEINALKGLDLLIYTHIHDENYNKEAAEEIYQKTKCKVLAELSVYVSLRNVIPEEDLIQLKSFEVQTYHIRGITIKAVGGSHTVPVMLPLIEVDGIRFFDSADSSYVTTINLLGGADVAFVGVGGGSPSTSPEHAYKIVKALQPKVTVVTHGDSWNNKLFLQTAQERGFEAFVPEVKQIYVVP